MRAQGSNKQIKQVGRARIQQPLGVAGRDWKEELKQRGLAKKKQMEEKMALKKQAVRNAKKEKELDGELGKVMNKKKEEKQTVRISKKKEESITESEDLSTDGKILAAFN